MRPAARSAAVLGAVAVSAALLTGLTSTGPATAAAPGCGVGACGGGDDDWTGTAYSVTITVRGGTGGGGSTGTFSVAGPPPVCWSYPRGPAAGIEPYMDVDAEAWANAGWTPEDRGYDSTTRLPLGHAENLLTEGVYWSPTCRGATTEESFDYFDATPITFVEPGEAPPLPAPPSVEQLLVLATEHLAPPEPEVNVNPAARSYVRLPTWVWTDAEDFEEIGVRAEAGPNWVDIVALPSGMAVSSTAGYQEGSCASGGVAWAPGATTDCALVFERASVARGTWDLTVETTWAASYTTSEQPAAQPLAPRTAGTTVEVPVAEVQSVVRGDSRN